MNKLSLLVAILALAVAAQAQRFGGGFSAPANNNPGIPASVTSTTPSNHNPGIPASVTSIRSGSFSGSFGFGNGFHHHHHNNGFGTVIVPVPVYGYGYSYPVVGDYLLTNEDAYIPSYARPQPWDQTQQQPVTYVQPQAPAEPVYQPPQISSTPAPQTTTSQQQPTEPSEPQPETVLVFKDGHVMQVANYVIVGSTLYNLSGSYRQYKIALADLDLDATIKANQDRGLEFNLPKKPA